MLSALLRIPRADHHHGEDAIRYRSMSLTPLSSGPSRGFMTFDTPSICGFRLHSFVLFMLLICE